MEAQSEWCVQTAIDRLHSCTVPVEKVPPLHHEVFNYAVKLGAFVALWLEVDPVVIREIVFRWEWYSMAHESK